MEVDFSFTPDEKSQLLKVARDSITGTVTGKRYEPPEPESERLRQKAGAFVTLHLHGELRGCIGLVEGYLPVYETVAQMAAKAAVADPRFDSVAPSELGQIEIEISVLSPMKKIGNYEDVMVGRHGVMIEKGYMRGLLLPQVATENGWDKHQFLSYVCLKAGLGREEYKDPHSSIYVFTAEVFGEGEVNEKREVDVAERT